MRTASFQKRSRTILYLALPIIGGMLSQTLMNFADMIMVGHLENADQALNAQGVASQAVWAVASLLIGIGSAVQSWSSRRMGAGQPRQSGIALSLALWSSIGIGLPVSLLGVLYASDIIQLLIHNPSVRSLAEPYYTYRTASWFLVMMNFSFRGFFNGISRPRVYFTVIWISQIANVAFSLVLIYGFGALPAMGVAGAGLGTTLATLLGTIIYFIIAFFYQSSHGVFHIKPTGTANWRVLQTLWKLSIPAGLTGVLTSAGFLVFMVITDQIGTTEAAASTILVQIASLSFLPAIGFGLAAATLVSRNLGAGKADEAYQWGLDTAKLGSGLLGAIGLLFVIAPGEFLTLATHNPQIIARAELILQILGLGLFFDSIGNILSQALIGAGHIRPVLIWNVVGMWLIFLPGAWLFGLYYNGGMPGLWLPLFVYRTGLALAMLIIFRHRHWVHIRI
ncbi:MAG: MATE family efflux transporter [Leptospiraceae bacterium]|nr:MATE family efflux transporter [Leptospiraceae bacterium]